MATAKPDSETVAATEKQADRTTLSGGSSESVTNSDSSANKATMWFFRQESYTNSSIRGPRCQRQSCWKGLYKERKTLQRQTRIARIQDSAGGTVIIEAPKHAPSWRIAELRQLQDETDWLKTSIHGCTLVAEMEQGRCPRTMMDYLVN